MPDTEQISGAGERGLWDFGPRGSEPLISTGGKVTDVAR